MFINSNSEIVNKIYQTLQATKELMVSSLIYGEEYTGKKTLIKKLYANSAWVDGSNIGDIKEALKNNSSVVITNFEQVRSLDILNFENVNVVAIYNGKEYSKNLENKFAFFYYMPSLIEREEDIKLFANHYSKEANEIFNIKNGAEIELKDIDISQNLKSLKRSIFRNILFKNVTEDDLSSIMYQFFLKNYKGINVYKEQLEIFEKALLKAGLDIYGSQLKLSEVLGINRNTLRKKINENL